TYLCSLVSLPTRRSSDLPLANTPREPAVVSLGFEITKRYERKRFTWLQVERLNWQASVGNRMALQTLPPIGETEGCPSGMLRVRSEEHTSELQSRENLVC